MLKMLKQLFCRHNYVPKVWLYEYHDVDGVHVFAYRCYCSKCGKSHNKKFMNSVDYYI